MDKSLESLFQFYDYRINSINFSVNPDFSSTNGIDIDMTLEVETKVYEKASTGSVAIVAKFFSSETDNYPFKLDLVVEGFFGIKSEAALDSEILHKRIRLNGTTALFPFLRSAVADITKAANVPPLIIPLVNIHKLLEKQ